MGAYDILLDKSLIKSKEEKVTNAIEMGVSHLEAENANKALETFERALETDTKVPSAWIGRAYAIALRANKGDAEFNNELISDYITKGLDLIPKSAQQLKDDASAIGMSLYLDFYANTIGQTVEVAVQSRVESEKAASEAGAALLGAVVGGVVGASSKSGVGKVIGYSAAGAGAATSVAKSGESDKLAEVGEGVFSTAIKIALLSVPVVISVYNSTKVVSDNLKNKLNTTLDLWRTSVNYLFTEQANRIDSMVDTIIAKLKKPKEAIEFLSDSNDVQEIKNLVVLADEVGLDNHKSFELLSSIDDDIKSIGEKEAMIKDIEGAKSKRVKGWFFGVGCLFLFFMLIDVLGDVALLIDLAALYFMFAWGMFHKSDTQKKLIEVFKKLKSNKSVFASVKNEDFEFEALGM